MIKAPMGKRQEALFARALREHSLFGKLRCENYGEILTATKLARRGLLTRLTPSSRYFELTQEGLKHVQHA